MLVVKEEYIFICFVLTIMYIYVKWSKLQWGAFKNIFTESTNFEEDLCTCCTQLVDTNIYINEKFPFLFLFMWVQGIWNSMFIFFDNYLTHSHTKRTLAKQSGCLDIHEK